jgi:ribosome-associated translation inhibitor RaiA/cold shock CspA family protein
MQVPPEIAFRNIEPTDELKARIQEGIESLEEVYDRIITCRVMVEQTNPGRQSGNLNHVRLDITIPRNELIINRNPPARPTTYDLPQAIGEAFDKARRQLREFKRIQRGDVKTPGLPPHGRIVRVVEEDSNGRFGFLESRNGRTIYFHENAVSGIDFEDLEVGMEVRFVESDEGTEGPQASLVAPLEDHDIGPRREGEIPLRTPREGAAD